MLVIAVINVDASTVLGYSDLTCHLENTDQIWKKQLRDSQSRGKNTRVLLGPVH